jgi:hypothetical protein
VTREQWNQLMTEQYNVTMEGLEAEERKVELQRLQEESGAFTTATTDTREPITRVKGLVKQFEQLVSDTISPTHLTNRFFQATSVYRMNGDIEVVGSVIFVGPDQAARQASGIFAGSANARTLINEHSIPIQSLVDDVTTMFRCVLNGLVRA